LGHLRQLWAVLVDGEDLAAVLANGLFANELGFYAVGGLAVGAFGAHHGSRLLGAPWAPSILRLKKAQKTQKGQK
jgi:hypothetical protein